MPKATDSRLRPVQSAQTPNTDIANTVMNGVASGLAAPTDDDNEFDTRLKALIDELGGTDNTTVQVFKMPSSGKGRLEFVDETGLDEIENSRSLHSWIKSNYGGGIYTIHVRDAQSIRINRRVVIAEIKTPHEPMGGLAGALQQMQQNQQQFIQQVASLIQPRQDTEEQMLARMKTMAEIMGMGQAKANSGVDLTQAMNMFNQGLALGQKMTPAVGATGSDLLLETVRSFAPVLAASAVAQKPRARQPDAQGTPAISHPLKAPVPASVPVVKADEPGLPADAADDVDQWRALITLVISAARAQRDPALYAEIVLDQLGDDAVTELLAQPDPLALIEQQAPAVRQYRDWFGACLSAMRDLLSQTDEGVTHANLAAGREVDAAEDA